MGTDKTDTVDCTSTYPDDWAEMKAYVGFSEDDSKRLAEVYPLLRPHFRRIVGHFYEVIADFPGARGVLKDDAQVERLRKTLLNWLTEVFQGPHDLAYFRRRRQIGEVHVRVGLDERYMFTAMSVMRSDLLEVAAEVCDGKAVGAVSQSILRITDLDLAAMITSYLETRELARLQALHSEVVQNLPAGVICIDREGEITAITEMGRSILEREISVGDRALEVLPQELFGQTPLAQLLEQVVASGTAVHVGGVSLGAGEAKKHLRVSVVPMTHDLSDVLIKVEDITEERQGELRARQSESLAKIGALTANLAHEIRNPLAGISSTVQVVIGGLPESDRRRRALSLVTEQVSRLDHLVTDLLLYGRVIAPTCEVTDLGALALEVINDRGFKSEFVDLGAPMVWADPDCVCQVLVNLLQNAAVAAGPEGKVLVRVGPGPQLEVLDDGPGVSPSVKETLFEAFVTTKARGTGLGLAISCQLLEAMSGTLELVENPNQPLRGACFRLGLPSA